MNTCKLCNRNFDFCKVQISEILDKTGITFTPNLNRISEKEKFKYCPSCGRKLSDEDFGSKNK